MPEVRQDSLLGYRVLFAPERATRPFEHAEISQRQPLARCPFCRGNESETTAAVLELPAVDAQHSGEWGVRVITNRYPAVSSMTAEIEAAHKPAREESRTSPSSFKPQADFDEQATPAFEVAPAYGVHEVIIEAPQHVISMTDLSAAQFQLIVQSYRDRLRDIRNSGAAVHANLFKNDGPGAGASLEHVHSQLIATSFVADTVAAESHAAAAYFQLQSRCYFCDLMQHEQHVRERLVFETDDFVCWCPFASRYASEMWLVPRRHRACFEDLDDSELAAFAHSLRDSLRRLNRVLPQAPFNFVLHSAAFRDAAAPHFHWHLEIKPRVMGLAGFEIGAGCHINVTLPEVAAATLRSALD